MVAGPFKVEAKPYTLEPSKRILAAERRTAKRRKGKLVARWKFDEISGGTAADSSGNNLVGTLVGDPQWRPSGGKIGGALEFDGDDDYVNIDGSESIGISGDQITVCAWIRADRIDERQVIAAKTAWGDNTWLVEINPTDFGAGVLNFFLSTGGSDNFGSESAIDAGTWHHVAFVYDGMERIIYLDGKLDAGEALSGDVARNDQPVRIGSWGGIDSSGQMRYFRGRIDDVRLYDYALTQADITVVLAGKAPGEGTNWTLIWIVALVAAIAAALAICLKKQQPARATEK